MNSKKNKNKNRPNKVPNPNPPQKVEESTVVEQEVQQIQETVESVPKVEERVPEIISEVVQPVLDSEDKNDDTPKKPKRNRGKKKKQDTDGQEETSIESQEIKEESEVVEQEVVPEIPEVTPSARKKKNKGKKTSEAINVVSEKKDEDIILEKEESKTDKLETECEALLPKTDESPLDQETKASKKKNKKKKHRTESEKSDKAEELSCVAAFQKLLKDETKTENILTSSTDKGQSTTEKIVPEITEVTEHTKENVEEQSKDIISEVAVTETNKGKKKNKKEKKVPPTEENKGKSVEHTLGTEVEVIAETGTMQPSLSQSLKEIATVVEVAPKEIIASSENIVLAEDDTKCKAKIAKPVERKRQEKATDTAKAPTFETTVVESESLSVDEKSQSFATSTKTKEVVEEFKIDNKQEEALHSKEASQSTELFAMPPLSMEMDIKTMSKSDVLPTPESEMGKKRKKSPKPKKHRQTSEIDQPAPESMMADICTTAIITETEIKPQEKDNIKETVEVITPLMIKDTNVDVKSDVLPTSDIEINKKRKKSPKPKKSEPTTEPDQIQVLPSMPEMCVENIISDVQVNPQENKPQAALEEIATPSMEFEAKTQTKSDVLPIRETETAKKSKKSSKPKKHQQAAEIADAQVQMNIIPNVPTEHIILETQEEPEENKSLEACEITTPPVDICTKPETREEIVPSPDIESGKKSKKSSKQKKHHQTAETDATPIPIVSSDTVTEDIIFKTEVKPEVKPEEIKTEETTEPIPKLEIHEETENKAPERSKKKRKKSPKLHIDSTTEANVLEAGSSKESTVKESELLTVEKNTEGFSGTPVTDDLEISSLRADESEGSISGFTPDIIQYPRATSQDLFDDNNNNMVIQEISIIEETKLQIPFQMPDTPFISGSGETPLVTPEIKIPSNVSKNSKVQPSESEKTDIKSKMMEVNQDMEELRLSIEKSLAELTTIEQAEEHIEKQFVDKMLTITEEPHSVEVKSSEIAKVSQIEKVDEVLQPDNQVKKAQPLEESAAIAENKDVEIKKETENVIKTPSELNLPIDTMITTDTTTESVSPPICPARKDHKNKGKSKKKGKQDTALPAISTESSTTILTSENIQQEKDAKTGEKTEQKPESTKDKGKQQCEIATEDKHKSDNKQEPNQDNLEFEPIENFEDAMTSSVDDINKSFEMIANDANRVEASHVNPEINIIAPIEDAKQEKRDEKVNPLSQPKNLLGHPDIPVPSNRMDYKKEKNKSPNEILAKVKIKDSIEVEAKRHSKESQTDNIRKFMKNKSMDESFSLVNENDDFVYKYSFRKVFLQSSCHVCKKDLKQSRVPCSYCSLVFYCSGKHKDEDWAQHQALCFAVSTIGHLKDQKHIYADAKNVTGQNYRLLRMQMIVSCEKVLKRRLVPWEQEALLYPRICADVSCREWRQSKLVDCEGCAQISYCAAHPDHFPKYHQRWCKSYNLYQKLVSYQQTKGRLEPKLPGKVMVDYQIPDKMNEVLASMYEEKIDMSDIQYAALTQIATAPLTAAYCYQLASKHQPHTNGTCKRTTCTIHVVDAELQFEADALNKWELFFLHLVPADELRVVMVSERLNPGDLPLELLSRIKLCNNCRMNNRRVIFNFQDKQTYYDYWAGEDYITPNIVCAFNANISRSSLYNSKDPWPKTISCILKQKVPFLITAHTLNEIHKDFATIKENVEQKYEVIVQPKTNNFASLRPDRNFISDDEMPLLFKNYCYALLVGV